MVSCLEKTIQYIAYTFLFLLPWQTIFLIEERFVDGIKWEYGTFGMYATEMLGWVCVVLFIVWYILRIKDVLWRNNNFSWTRDRIFVLSLLIFVTYGLVIAFFATDQSLAFQSVRRILLASLLLLLFFVGPIKSSKALWVFVLGSVPVSILGIYQFLFQTTFASSVLGLSQHVAHEFGTSIVASESIWRWLRAYGSFSHPNVFGGYLILTLLSSLLLFGSSSIYKKIILHLIIILQSIALFFTFSRSSWIALCMVFLFYCYFALRKNKYLHLFPFIPIILSFFVLSTIYFPIFKTRFEGVSQNEIASIAERSHGYTQAILLIKEQPIVGVGVGNYTYALMTLYADMPVWLYQPVHNVIMLIVAEKGIIGFLLLIFVFASFFRLLSIYYTDYLLFFAGFLPLLLFDHYLWSSYVGVVIFFVYTSLYFRYVQDIYHPHLVHR